MNNPQERLNDASKVFNGMQSYLKGVSESIDFHLNGKTSPMPFKQNNMQSAYNALIIGIGRSEMDIKQLKAIKEEIEASGAVERE